MHGKEDPEYYPLFTLPVKVTDYIILAASQRKLMPAELKDIQDKLDNLSIDSPEKTYWSQVFKDPQESHEANAFMFLWKYLAPIDLQSQYNDKLIGIKATRVGSSYNGNLGWRTTH